MNTNPKSRRFARFEPTCKDEVDLIADYVVGRLHPKMLEAFEKHLGQCPDCAAFLNTYKKTIDATKSFLKLQSPDVDTRRIKLQPRRRGSLVLLGSGCIFLASAFV